MTLHLRTFAFKGTVMTRIRTTFLIALAVIGMGSTTLPAQAHDKAGHAPGQQAGQHGGKHAGQKMDREQRHAKRAARSAARQQQLHDALALSTTQQAAWSSYSAAIKPQPRGQRIERAAMAAMPAPQRIEQRLDMARQRMAAMQARLAATTRFYAVLTPEQKKVFDATTVGHGQRGHGKQRQMRG